MKCVQALNKELQVTPLQYTVVQGEQTDGIDYDQVKSGDGFEVTATSVESNVHSIHSAVKYDLI